MIIFFFLLGSVCFAKRVANALLDIFQQVSTAFVPPASGCAMTMGWYHQLGDEKCLPVCTNHERRF